MYDPEDFYREPSEFEEQVEEFKESLRKSVKQEFLDEMERLRKENKNLRDIKDKLDLFEREKRKELSLLREKTADAAREARRVRFNQLFAEFMPAVYCVSYHFEKGPKCDKCDENRIIYYTTPLGRKASEYCTCNQTRTVFEPEVRYASEIRLNNWGGNDGLIVWYKPKRDDEDVTSRVFKGYCDEMRPEDIEDKNLAAFKEMERCQAYCDWLNEKERAKEKEGEQGNA